MPNRDIIVVGASLGGVEALKKLMSGLPPDLDATIFVVLHVSPHSRSMLPQLLSAVGPLPTQHPAEGEKIQRGTVYVAPPNVHLVIAHDHIHLDLGPKEQHQRPSINKTFRSAADAYGPRVIGVILTGLLDDGVAGLWEIKRHRGLAVVQHPEDAAYPGMPLSAIKDVDIDHIVKLSDLPDLLARLCCEDTQMKTEDTGGTPIQQLTDFTCPECRGTIWKVLHGPTVEYRCRVGHCYSPKTMLAEHFATQERLMWGTIVALEEGALLAEELAGHFAPEVRARLQAEAEQRAQQASQLRQILVDRISTILE